MERHTREISLMENMKDKVKKHGQMETIIPGDGKTASSMVMVNPSHLKLERKL